MWIWTWYFVNCPKYFDTPYWIGGDLLRRAANAGIYGLLLLW